MKNNKFKCPNCNGKGWIRKKAPPTYALKYLDIQCSACKGTGYVSKEIHKAWGEKEG